MKLTKQKLRQIIKEEILNEGANATSIMKFVDSHKDAKYPVAIKLQGGNGSTNWMNIELDVLKKLAKLTKK